MCHIRSTHSQRRQIQHFLNLRGCCTLTRGPDRFLLSSLGSGFEKNLITPSFSPYSSVAEGSTARGDCTLDSGFTENPGQSETSEADSVTCSANEYLHAGQCEACSENTGSGQGCTDVMKST